MFPERKTTWAKGIISFIDITDKKNTEQALKESENQLQEILENVDDVFYMMSGRNGGVIYINSAYEKIWKRPVAEIMKNPETWLYAVHPEDVNSAKKLFEQGSGELQYRIILPDGSIRWIWDRMFPILDEKGEIAYLCGIAADITERKLYEETLSESEAKLDEAMKIAKLGTWEYDVVHDQFKFNDQFYTLLRTTVEQEGGYIMSAMQYSQKFVHPEDVGLVGMEIQKALETIDPDYNSRLDHRVICADGETGYVNANIRVEKDANGRTVRTYGVNQDITERKRVEESLRLFRTLIDKSNDAIEVIDLETGQFIDVNERACTNLGYSRNELLNMKVFDVDPNQTPESFQSIMDGVQHSKSTIIETLNRHKDGSIFPVEVNVTAVKLEKNYAIAIVRDITERKLAEKELAASEERYKLLFESAAEGILVVDVEMQELKLVNKAACQMFGYTEQEMTGLSISNLHPVEFLKDLISVFESQAQGNDPISGELPCKRKDGTLFYANVYSVTVLIDDRKHSIGFFTDVTAHKEANEKVELFRTLIEQSNDAIELIDLETGRFLDCNEKAFQSLGYTREELLSLKLFDIDPTLTKDDYSEAHSINPFYRQYTYRGYPSPKGWI